MSTSCAMMDSQAIDIAMDSIVRAYDDQLMLKNLSDFRYLIFYIPGNEAFPVLVRTLSYI